MARTTAQLLAQLERFLPKRYGAYRAVLAGIAGALASAETTADELADSVTVGGAEGAWLALLARGYGVTKASDESDESVRQRLRYAEDQVSRDAILTAVNRLLTGAGAGPAGMLEPWTEGFLDYDCYADDTRLCDAHNSFVLVVPLVGDRVGGSSYVDVDYLDSDLFVGLSGEEDPVYEAIRALVNRIRAAGVRAWLAIDT